MLNPTVRGLSRYRCVSHKVVRGNVSESTRFHPLRGWLQSHFVKPTLPHPTHSHDFLECGLTRNEIDAVELDKNLRDDGASPHHADVIQAIDSHLPPKPGISLSIGLQTP